MSISIIIITTIITTTVNYCHSIIINTNNHYWTKNSTIIDTLYTLPECCHGGNHWKPYKGCSSSSSSSAIAERYIGPCSSLSNNITSYDFYELLNNTRRNVIIMGDSLSRQWYESIVCYLNLTWDGFNNNANDREKLLLLFDVLPLLSDGETLGYTVATLGQSKIIYYNIAHVSLNHIKKIISYHNRANDSEYGYRLVIDYKAIHFRDKVKDLESFRDGLRQLVSHCIEINANCVLRETSAQHFVDPKHQNVFDHGLFNESYARVCYPFTSLNTYNSLGRWRNEQIWLERQSLNVLPYYDAMISQPSSHHFQREHNNDCTHMVFNMRFWEPLHLALLMNLKNSTCYSTFQN